MLYIHICLEYDEEDFVKDPNYISKDADFLNIDDEEVEEWTKFGILCYFDLEEFGCFIN